ncbi:DUF1735 domain-containing protein [Pedobacter sp. HMF7647]|uniref:DUF1735 domain-containing protein n=1 Tax=Hufsiella arboris TaxID=2695275 RepID=A0A7K1Y5L9_9SPHI|nr:DUF1735 domain-containing protein [Hufsiella arboris]MXV49882.1 DUF1735 domain-containing protein [Hufsiella arboris]
MKNALYKFIPGLLAVLTLSFSSCLKENEDTYVDFTKVGTTVELPLAALNQETSVKVKVQTYTAADAATLPVVINVASPEPLKKDLAVTLGINANDALTAFNTANKTAYVLLPATAYTVSSLSATIPSGQRTATITFQINTAIVGTTTNYVLPVTLIDASGEKISNYNTVFYNIVIR